MFAVNDVGAEVDRRSSSLVPRHSNRVVDWVARKAVFKMCLVGWCWEITGQKRAAEAKTK